MSTALLQLLDAHDGVLARRQALTVVSHDVLDRLAARGRVIARAFPEIFVATGYADDPTVRRRAALRYVGVGALSHLDALEEWGLPGEPADPADLRVHVTASEERSASTVPGLALHRRKGFSIGPPLTVVRNESEVVRLEQAVIESWPLLSRVDRRAPAIVAVRDRRTTPDRLMKTLACQPRTSGAREMRELFTAMKDGCRSELELWGHANVFSHRGFPLSEGQLPVPRGKSVVYLDRAFVEELVDVEMDGATYHSAPGQRERDIRRDAWLARLGWLVVRLSHRRLHADRQGVREELLEILRVRRRQLGLQPR